jgi:UDP-N-acetylmuramoylalanine--D-glutamate ligase
MDDFSNKRVTVLGLGRFGGGIGVARWLAQRGARVRVTDEASTESLADSVARLRDQPNITFRLGEHVDADFTDTDLVVTSPAVRPAHPMLELARCAGIPVTLEIRLFIERCPANTVLGVTGTKGKSTTTALLGRMLEQKFRTRIGGNIGGTLLGDLPDIRRDDVVVLELSSYMLEHLAPMRWSPHIAVVTMVSQDHLDWHGGVDGYHSAKRNIVRFQAPQDFAVLNEENELSHGFAAHTAAKVVRYGVEQRPPFLLRIAGRHNQLNAQAAFAAAQCLGVTREQAQLGIAGFMGLPHRMQVIHESNGVTWVNDSIATIPEAAVAASLSFPPGQVIQIVGGYDKHLDWAPMCQKLARNCKAVLTVGAIGPRLAELTRAERAVADVRECGDLQRAVVVARQVAEPGDIILLSTGTASYDQFPNFEKRGEAFAALASEQ